jgi:hypothetical protein
MNIFFSLVKLTNQGILFLSENIIKADLIKILIHKKSMYKKLSMRLGVFCLITYLLSWFFLGPDNYTKNINIIVMALQLVGIMLCFILSTNGLWRNEFKNYLPILWIALIGYCLPFLYSLMFFINPGKAEAIPLLASILLIFIFLDSYLAIIIVLTYSLLAYFLSTLLLDNTAVVVHAKNLLTIKFIVYNLGVSFLISVLFIEIRYKANLKFNFQDKSNAIFNDKITQNFIEIAQKEIEFFNAINKNFISSIWEINKLSNSILENTAAHKAIDITQAAKFINQTSEHILKNIKQNHRVMLNSNLEKTEISIEEFIINFEKELIANHMHRNVHIHNLSKIKTIVCDVKKLYLLMMNGIKLVNLFSNANEALNNFITIYIGNAKLTYPTGADNKEIEAMKIAIIINEKILIKEKSVYTLNMDNKELINMVDSLEDFLPFYANSKILQLYHGYSKCLLEPTGHIEQLYVIPQNIESLTNTNSVNISQVKKADNDEAKQEIAHDKRVDAYEKQILTRVEINNKIDQVENFNKEKIKKALQLAKKYYCNQNYVNGEPLYLQVIETANIVLNFLFEEDILIASLLHKIINLDELSLESIEELFGSEIAIILKNLDKMDDHGLDMYKIKKYSYYNNLKSVLAQLNRKALYIKLAEEVHYIRTIYGLGEERISKIHKKKAAEECLLYFVPIAKFLNFPYVIADLNSLCIEILNN